LDGGDRSTIIRDWSGYLDVLACITPPNIRMLLALSSAIWDQLVPGSEQMI